jgi:hypothetical protein
MGGDIRYMAKLNPKSVWGLMVERGITIGQVLSSLTMGRKSSCPIVRFLSAAFLSEVGSSISTTKVPIVVILDFAYDIKNNLFA